MTSQHHLQASRPGAILVLQLFHAPHRPALLLCHFLLSQLRFPALNLLTHLRILHFFAEKLRSLKAEAASVLNINQLSHETHEQTCSFGLRRQPEEPTCTYVHTFVHTFPPRAAQCRGGGGAPGPLFHL